MTTGIILLELYKFYFDKIACLLDQRQEIEKSKKDYCVGAPEEHDLFEDGTRGMG